MYPTDRALPEKLEEMPKELPISNWLTCGSEEEKKPLLDKSETKLSGESSKE